MSTTPREPVIALWRPTGEYILHIIPLITTPHQHEATEWKSARDMYQTFIDRAPARAADLCAGAEPMLRDSQRALELRLVHLAATLRRAAVRMRTEAEGADTPEQSGKRKGLADGYDSAAESIERVLSGDEDAS